ncbi:MAG: hypothetical protein H7Z75_06795, partial [Ferruginibacter sp.]|nr:hypothetical protein [Cytophagales bacterium]
MKQRILVMLLSLGLLSCQEAAPVNTVRNGRITIIDSTGRADQRAPFARNATTAYYPVYFIGYPSETFRLGAKPISMFSNPQLEEKYDLIRNWTFADSVKMRIHVDTTFELAYQKIFYKPQEEAEDTEVIDSV